MLSILCLEIRWKVDNYCCTSLEEVIFADGSKVRHIGKNAFAGSGLKKIRIPREVDIADNAFLGCEDVEICRNEDKFVLDCEMPVVHGCR